ncbi:hypothetical protein RB653_004855 [Dictyostelium firmibasis]|uniref:Uncharacterized protein n=1 Tax=Dictyostelium firmibasis TaxID=79012 RepID=A0AAN7YSL2_9MYCE
MKTFITILLNLIFGLVLIKTNEIKKIEKYGGESGLYFSWPSETDTIYNAKKQDCYVETQKNNFKKVENYGEYGLYFSFQQESDIVYNVRSNNKEKEPEILGSKVESNGKDFGWFFLSPVKEGEYLYNSKFSENGGFRN